MAKIKTWPTANETLLVIRLHDAVAVSEALLADVPGARFRMPWPEIHSTSHIARRQASTHPSIDLCIIHEARKIFCEGK